ncbi:hypothetical protein EON65_09530 [archaeon]|nr:MAG: hypothetical protein EON65_09530 [archaeon]
MANASLHTLLSVDREAARKTDLVIPMRRDGRGRKMRERALLQRLSPDILSLMRLFYTALK